jgi:hypothetical protein
LEDLLTGEHPDAVCRAWVKAVRATRACVIPVRAAGKSVPNRPASQPARLVKQPRGLRKEAASLWNSRKGPTSSPMCLQVVEAWHKANDLSVLDVEERKNGAGEKICSGSLSVVRGGGADYLTAQKCSHRSAHLWWQNGSVGIKRCLRFSHNRRWLKDRLGGKSPNLCLARPSAVPTTWDRIF